MLLVCSQLSGTEQVDVTVWTLDTGDNTLVFNESSVTVTVTVRSWAVHCQWYATDTSSALQ
jgi:hypothetical protein